jgi:glutathione S-transferase
MTEPTPAPTLYSFRRCPYAIRARLALLVSGTPFALHEVRLAAKPAEMLAASPKGTVPVLVLPGGEVIDESLDIMRWALRRHDPERWLEGDDAALIATNDGPFKHHLDRAKYPHRYEADSTDHRAAALDLLAPLEDRLRRQPYLCGSTRSLTDAAIVPFVRQFSAIDRDWFAAQPVPMARGWLERQIASPLFEQVMAKQPAA